jgi:hypothetical protein
MERPTREALFYALLFAIPSGIGIASVVDITVGAPTSYVVFSGVVGGLVVAGFVLLVATTGSETA